MFTSELLYTRNVRLEYNIFSIPQIFLEMIWQAWMAWGTSAALAPGAPNRLTVEEPRVPEPPARWRCWGRGARSSCNRVATHSRCRVTQDLRRCHKVMAISSSMVVEEVKEDSIHLATAQMVLEHLLAILQAAAVLVRVSQVIQVTKASLASQDTLVNKATQETWAGSNSSRCSSKCTAIQASQCLKVIMINVALLVQDTQVTEVASQANTLQTLNNRAFHRTTLGSLATLDRIHR